MTPWVCKCGKKASGMQSPWIVMHRCAHSISGAHLRQVQRAGYDPHIVAALGQVLQSDSTNQS